MTNFTITHVIDSPELAAALNNLAEALRTRPAVVSTAGQNAPAQAEPARETLTQIPTATPAPAPIATPTVAPEPAVSTTPAQTYTFEDITNAGSQLLGMNKMPQLMKLLEGYGVKAVTQLKPEQYASVAAGLRELGATI